MYWGCYLLFKRLMYCEWPTKDEPICQQGRGGGLSMKALVLIRVEGFSKCVQGWVSVIAFWV